RAVPAPTETNRTPARSRAGVSDLLQRFGLLVVWAAVIVVFGVLKPDTFLTGENFSTIFGSQSVLVVLTLALIVPMTTGDFDLSVAFTLMLSSMLIAILNVQHHWAIVPAMVVAVGAGATVGLVNGSIVTFFGIDAIIVTLGTGTFLGGIVLWISDSNTISGVSNSLVNPVVADRLFGIPLEFYYGLALCFLIWYVFEFTPLGRRLLIVGRGRSVARLSGLRVDRIRIGAMIAAGVLASIAGILYTGTTGAADPSSGQQLLLPAFAAAFLGATTIMPGRFNPWGSFLAVYFLVTGITGLQLLGVQSFVQNLFYGGALVVAVALSQLARRRQALEAGAS
ncbi:MAG TPA: ABC transporter permease, partial [Conexibacter sp.]|nr:ABC transporter permease [Conexibacter sp.]